jgi:hypothetical protein
MGEICDIQAIDRRRRAMKITKTRLCAAADVGRRTYDYLLAGVTRATSAVLAKLNFALKRFANGYGSEADRMAPLATSASCQALAAKLLNTDIRAVLMSDPQRRATANPEWLKTAHARQLGYWIANGCFGMRTSDIARASHLTKQAVSSAIADVEDRRDRDAELDRICTSFERMFQP